MIGLEPLLEDLPHRTPEAITRSDSASIFTASYCDS